MDYCLYPNTCGIGSDCRECYQKRIAELEAENERLRAHMSAALSQLRTGTSGGLRRGKSMIESALAASREKREEQSNEMSKR